MSELPLNWAATTLGTLCDKGQYGWTTKATSKGVVKFLRTTDITKGPINWSSVPYCMEAPPDIGKYLVKVNDILISRAGSVGFSTLIEAVPSPTVFASYLIRFVPSEKVSPRFVAYFLRSANYWHQIGEAAAGIALANVNAAKLADFDAPLPPFNEQKRIADKLDTVLARVEACREHLDRVPGILKRLRQSVLAAATSGELTEEWRAQCDRDVASWDQSTVGALIEKIEAGLNVQCDERPPRDGERGLVKISAVTWGTYDDDESKTLPPGKQVPDSTRIRIGDFLISRANTLELVGACVIVHKVSRPVFLSDKILRLVMPDAIKPWLLYVMQSEQGRRQIERLASGNQLSMRNLSQASLRSIKVPFPQEDEREEIVRRVEALFAYVSRLHARYTAVRNQVERLTPALLAKAFRGEMVPQDPNDEPASVLLERIRAAREIAPTKPKTLEIARGAKMSKATAESIRGIIRQLPDDRFTFDDLRSRAATDYETLKDILFVLLSEAQPTLKQVFDTKAKSMRFVRVNQ